MNKLFKVLAALLVVVVVMAVYAAKDSSRPAVLTKQKLGNAWPFTTESAVVGCESGRLYVLTNGQKYALNGSATGARTPDGKKMYGDLDEVWLPDPANGPGGHKSLTAVMDAAQKECDK